MKRMFAIMTAAFLAVGVLAVSGCSSNDAVVTCDNFDYYLETCIPECTVTWDCEGYYDTLPVEDQIILDDCSDCLAANADELLCQDCTYDGGYSCFDFFQVTLDMDCW